MTSDAPSSDDPRYTGFRAGFLWGWFQVDEHDIEGLISITTPDGLTLPLIASDQVRLSELRLYARMTARATGRPVHLRRFVADGEPWEVVNP